MMDHPNIAKVLDADGGSCDEPSEKTSIPAWVGRKKVLAVIAHYDRLTEEEAAAEIETASEAPGQTWMSVPTELVGVITRLIEDHEQKTLPARSGNYTKKARTSKARR